MKKELSQFYIYGKRKSILYRSLASGILATILTCVICSIIKIQFDAVTLGTFGLITSFILGLLISNNYEQKLYAERTYTPPRQKYLGEIFLDEYSDDQLFEDIEKDKELQEAIKRSKNNKKKKK